MLQLDAIIIEDDHKPDVTFNNALTHLGHTMNVLMFENVANGDIYWGVQTVDSRAIEGGVYPINHAEIDACYLISDELEQMPESHTLAESVTSLFTAISIVKETN